ncbi:MAG: SH3 domain-containing protein [Pyrinomonadaceae bacterium]
MKITSVLLLVFTLMLSIPYLTFAQQNRWVLISEDADDTLFYLDKSSRQSTENTIRVWTKNIYRDGSYRLSLVDWRCREKKYFFVEVATYNPAGSFVQKENGMDWINVVPDSISEAMYKAVCLTSSKKNSKTESTSKKIAEIIVVKANIRIEPNLNSQVIQQATTGERFILAEAEPSGGWYRVILAGMNETAWIHGNNIKLVEVFSKTNIKKQKANRKIKKQKSN